MINELLKVEIPNYISQILLSKKRKVKFFKYGGKIPKKYGEFGFVSKTTIYKLKPEYCWIVIKKDKILCVKATSQPVVKNSQSVGTERWYTINGQDIWSGLPHHIRSKLARELHEMYHSYLFDKKAINPLNYPVKIHYEIHDCFQNTPKLVNKDSDNTIFPYAKVFQDCLVEHKIIENDNTKFVNGGSHEYFEVTPDKRKLVITVYNDK